MSPNEFSAAQAMGNVSVYLEQLAGTEGKQRTYRVLCDKPPTKRLVREYNIEFTLREIYIVSANHFT
jgi:hypothetical protein